MTSKNSNESDDILPSDRVVELPQIIGALHIEMNEAVGFTGILDDVLVSRDLTNIRLDALGKATQDAIPVLRKSLARGDKDISPAALKGLLRLAADTEPPFRLMPGAESSRLKTAMRTGERTKQQALTQGVDTEEAQRRGDQAAKQKLRDLMNLVVRLRAALPSEISSATAKLGVYDFSAINILLAKGCAKGQRNILSACEQYPLLGRYLLHHEPRGSSLGLIIGGLSPTLAFARAFGVKAGDIKKLKGIHFQALLTNPKALSLANDPAKLIERLKAVPISKRPRGRKEWAGFAEASAASDDRLFDWTDTTLKRVGYQWIKFHRITTSREALQAMLLDMGRLAELARVRRAGIQGEAVATRFAWPVAPSAAAALLIAGGSPLRLAIATQKWTKFICNRQFTVSWGPENERSTDQSKAEILTCWGSVLAHADSAGAEILEALHNDNQRHWAIVRMQDGSNTALMSWRQNQATEDPRFPSRLKIEAPQSMRGNRKSEKALLADLEKIWSKSTIQKTTQARIDSVFQIKKRLAKGALPNGLPESQIDQDRLYHAYRKCWPFLRSWSELNSFSSSQLSHDLLRLSEEYQSTFNHEGEILP